MFVYTKNKRVIKQLEADKCPLMQTRSDGVKIYALSPTSTFIFEEQKNTWVSNKLTF